jgi:hypothetical protein
VDQNRFERLTKALAAMPSRRDVLRGLAGVGLGLGALHPPAIADAKKKRKRKKRKPKATPNHYGCLEVGDSCKNADQCCSGICDGKKGKRTCRAHDTGNCAAGAHTNDCGGTNVACVTSLGKQGYCATTTGQAAYCLFYDDCFACKTDADCQAANGGAFDPRAACTRCADCPQTGGTACATPDVPQTMVAAAKRNATTPRPW